MRVCERTVANFRVRLATPMMRTGVTSEHKQIVRVDIDVCVCVCEIGSLAGAVSIRSDGGVVGCEAWVRRCVAFFFSGR